MSELIQQNDNRATIRWKLLTGASALALTAYVSSADLARAEDSGQPQIWIELGGQFSRLEDGQETFSPSFPFPRPSIFSPSEKFERPPLFSVDGNGEISFQPEDSNWIFSASVRYGRSLSNRHVHQQTYPPSTAPTYSGGFISLTAIGARFADTRVRNSETHLLLDFQAGKDLGLGLFGGKGSSVLSAGVRIAQFRSNSSIALQSDPDWHLKIYTYNGHSYIAGFGQYYHSNSATLRASRSFKGIGPSLSWKASTPFAGNGPDGELTLDWGVNAALLFGRQTARTHHQTTGRYHEFFYGYGQEGKHITYQAPATPDHTRSRNVTVPNVGGFAGVSWRYNDAKVSLGYKADFFFGAIDGGIDAAKKEDRSFMGPYASISIGIGD